MDDTIDLPDKAFQGAGASLVNLEPLLDGLDLVRDMSALDVAQATPAQRGELVRLRGSLYRMDVAIRTHIATIDHLFRNAAAATGASAFPVGRNKADVVKIEKPRGTWRVKDAELRQGLQALAERGVIPIEDVDRAVSAEVIYHVDNRVVQGLLKYGDEVRELIERTRSYEPGNPATAPVSYPKGGR